MSRKFTLTLTLELMPGEEASTIQVGQEVMKLFDAEISTQLRSPQDAMCGVKLLDVTTALIRDDT